MNPQELLHSEDVRGCVFSFSSPSDLCALDLVSQDFRESATPHWRDRTLQRFGLTTGKDGYRLGISLLKKPVLLDLEDDGDFGFGCMYAGSANVATNGSIVVAVSDDLEGNEQERSFPGKVNGISVRDAQSLNFFRMLSSPIVNWRVAICGRPGSEVVVTSNSWQFSACRGSDIQQWSLRDLDPGFGAAGDGIPLLGCETHLILAAGGKVFLLKVGPEPEILSLRQSVFAVQKKLDQYQLAESRNWQGLLSWGDDQSHFVACFPQTNQMSIWKFDESKGTISAAQMVNYPHGLSISNVTLASDFVVASCSKKKIHVWDRRSGTGKKLHILCDVDQEEEVDEDDLVYPLSMVAMGQLLISTSHLGNALCIWNLKTGQLLKRHNDAEDQRLSDQLPDGVDVTGMVYLEWLNAFVCMSMGMLVWTFPANGTAKKMASSIRRRERNMKRVQLGFGQGEMFGDSDGESMDAG